MLPAPALGATVERGEAAGFVVSPVVLELEAEPGELAHARIRVRNLEHVAQRFRAEVVPAAPSAELDGGLVPADDSADQGAAPWIRLDRDHRAAALGAAIVELAIEVPEDAPAGSHHAAVRVDLVPAQGTTGGLVPGAVVLVFVTVAGDIRHELSAQLRSDHVLSSGGPQRWQLVVRNDGNVHERVAGTVTLAPMLGDDRRLELSDRFVLPGQERRLPLEVELARLPNVVTGRWERAAPDEGAGSHASIRVWVFPWWLAVAAALGLVTWWRLRRHG